MTKKRFLIGFSLALLAAVLLFAGTHRNLVHHFYSDPHELAARINEKVFDFDEGEESFSPPTDPRLAGLPNFGFVTDTLYRGAQPNPEGYRSLQQLGVEVVVDFRNEKDEIEAERQTVETSGMRFVSIPWRAMDQPNNKQVAQFLTLVQANPGKKIFVHCFAGHDRTGVMIAAFRLGIHHWKPEQALAEMGAFGFRHGWSHFWHYHLEEYVERFPQQLATDPDLRRVQAASIQPTSPPATPVRPN